MTDTIVDSKVQRTQAMLYAKASNEPEIQFKRLYKYLTKTEWVEVAVDKIMRSRGSRTAGIDGKTRKDYLEEDKRVELAQAISDELRTEIYYPDPVRQTYIPKPNGKKRPLGISIIKDRVVQQMVKMLIEPIFEAKFLPCSYGFRPNRCTWDALAEAYYFLRPPVIGQASRWRKGKYGQAYFHNRKIALRRDKYTCTVCGYKSQRQKGDVHDLEIHHINSNDDYKVDNLQTVCIPCHQQLTANKQAD